MAAITPFSVILMAFGANRSQSRSTLSESRGSLTWFITLEAVKQEGLDLLWFTAPFMIKGLHSGEINQLCGITDIHDRKLSLLCLAPSSSPILAGFQRDSSSL